MDTLNTFWEVNINFATGFPGSIWGRGWINCFCMMVKFGSVFLKWQSVCNFGIVEIFFFQFLVLVCLYITQVLHVIFHLHIFLLCNNFVLHKVLGTIIVHWRRPDSFWLAQLKAWAIMSYFWPRSMLICGVTRPQWVNSLAHGLACFGACKTTLTNNVLCITQINNNYWYEHNKTNTRKYTLCDILYALMANWSVFSSVSVTLGIKKLHDFDLPCMYRDIGAFEHGDLSLFQTSDIEHWHYCFNTSMQLGAKMSHCYNPRNQTGLHKTDTKAPMTIRLYGSIQTFAFVNGPRAATQLWSIQINSVLEWSSRNKCDLLIKILNWSISHS